MEFSMNKKYWKRTNAVTTRFSNIIGAIRATLWKNGERNVLKNITDGIGYEGIIECWECRDK